MPKILLNNDKTVESNQRYYDSENRQIGNLVRKEIIEPNMGHSKMETLEDKTGQFF